MQRAEAEELNGTSTSTDRGEHKGRDGGLNGKSERKRKEEDGRTATVDGIWEQKLKIYREEKSTKTNIRERGVIAVSLMRDKRIHVNDSKETDKPH